MEGLPCFRGQLTTEIEDEAMESTEDEEDGSQGLAFAYLYEL
jgi:hypothetical protein